jgi:hypothetical protein
MLWTLNLPTHVDAVLAEWLDGNGRQPITWETMLSGLCEADYGSIVTVLEGQFGGKFGFWRTEIRVKIPYPICM